ncbi:MAG: 5-(carboxyamino)imidazole ribonucleotide synthase [Hyphomicrobiaceae bacterium]|nr:5-(carboxyamino)imidazole ribonucleotide synthase [Hyphomicrobiaceae bacterium]
MLERRTIGILGGGQLGRMLALAASRLGFRAHIYCPDPQSPAFDVTRWHTCAAYEDVGALAQFAGAVDLVTYEFENIPDATVDFLAARKPLFPSAEALRISQDRILEKSFLAGLTSVAPFRKVETREELDQAIAAIGLPAVLKTTRFGYDGKGQRIIRVASDAESAFSELEGQILILEGFIDFTHEISVIVARSASGETATYDPAENVHRNHILDTSTVPASVSHETAARARQVAVEIVSELDYVGVMGVEFFVSKYKEMPKLLVNEIAPRVHNSGHWTEAVCVADQFEQHIRAITGLPLGDTTRLADVQMKNLLGSEIESIFDGAQDLRQPHDYGKHEPKPGRKMGHINRILGR